MDFGSYFAIQSVAPRNVSEKERMLSARKAVLREVLSHTQSVSSGMLLDQEENAVHNDDNNNNNNNNISTTSSSSLKPENNSYSRRIRSRQRQRRVERGKEWEAKLKKKVLKSGEIHKAEFMKGNTSDNNDNGNKEMKNIETKKEEEEEEEEEEDVDINMENEDEKKAVLKIQAIQRGRSERKKIENLKEEHKKVKRHRSATKIQSLVRGAKGRENFSEKLERSHVEWKREYMLRAVFKDGDLNEDGKLQVREFAAMLRNVSNLNGGGQAPTPSLVDVKKLMRRINAQYGIGIGDANNGKVEIVEDCFVEYFLSGLNATPRELALFARGGQYHEMLATLVVQMRNEILRRETEERLAASYAIFDKYDEDRSGEIDLNEMSQLISDYMGKRGRKYAPSEKEVQALMRSLDQSGDGLMDREEFQKFLMGGLARTVAERRQYAKKSKMHRKLAILLDRISFGIDRRTKALHSMFDAVDDDGSGFLTATELRELMAKYADHEGHVPSDEEVMEFMEQIDENGDMKLSKAEFVLFMLHNDDVVDETDSKVGQWRNHALEKVPW